MRSNLGHRVLLLGSALGIGLMLAACEPPARDQAAVSTAGPQAAPAATVSSAPQAATAAAAAPPEDASATEATPEAAESTLRRYYGAINAKDYAAAYALWGNGGQASRQTSEAFAHGYAKTLMVDAQVGKAFGAEGAAGSRYIQVPVELASAQADGSTRHYRGSFTLRAVMADGAPPQQRQWHLDSADIEGYEPDAPPKAPAAKAP